MALLDKSDWDTANAPLLVCNLVVFGLKMGRSGILLANAATCK